MDSFEGKSEVIWLTQVKVQDRTENVVPKILKYFHGLFKMLLFSLLII